MDVREAKREDGDALCALLEQFFAHVGNPWPGRSAFGAYFERQLQASRYTLFVAEDAGRLVGVVSAAEVESSFQFRPFLWVDDLFVVPESRGVGVGSRLLERVAALGRERGCASILLGTDSSNVGFFDRQGFRSLGGALLVRLLDPTD